MGARVVAAALLCLTAACCAARPTVAASPLGRVGQPRHVHVSGVVAFAPGAHPSSPVHVIFVSPGGSFDALTREDHSFGVSLPPGEYGVRVGSCSGLARVVVPEGGLDDLVVKGRIDVDWRVLLVDAAGNAAPGVELRLGDGDCAQRAFSDENGEFEVRSGAVPSAVAEDRWIHLETSELDQERGRWTLRITELPRTIITVTGEGGEVPDHAWLASIPPDPEGEIEWRLVTKGRANLYAQRQGKHRLVALANFGPDTRSGHLDIPPDQREAKLVLPSRMGAQAAEIVLRDERGEPLADFDVTLSLRGPSLPVDAAYARPGHLVGRESTTLRTGADGTARFEGLRPNATYVIGVDDRASTPRFVEYPYRHLRFSPSSEGGRRVLTLPRRHAVSGRLVDPSGQPITRFVIDFGQPTVDAQGRFRVEYPREELRIDSEGFVSRRIGLPAGAPRDLGDISLRRSRPVEWRVMDGAGAPVAMAGVLIHEDSGRERRAQTDANGRLSIAVDSESPWTVAINGGKSGTLVQQLTADAPPPHLLRVHQHGTFEVRGATEAGALCDGYFERTGAKTASGVRFQAGARVCWVSARGHFAARARAGESVELVPRGGPGRLFIVLPQRSHYVETLLVPGEVPLTDFTPALRDNGQRYDHGPPFHLELIGYPGELEYRDLPPGRYTLFVTDQSSTRGSSVERRVLDVKAGFNLVDMDFTATARELPESGGHGLPFADD